MLSKLLLITSLASSILFVSLNKLNAQNLYLTLKNQGFESKVAVNQNGLFRVFMYSADTEGEIRKALAKARRTYADAWMLKIAK